MREVQIKSWCDLCWQDGERKTETVTTWTVGVASGEKRPELKMVETCQEHQVMFADLQAKLATAAPLTGVAKPAVATRAPKGLGEIECRVCGDYLTTRAALVNHVWGQHRPSEQRATYRAGKCTECGFVANSTSGMSAHKSRSHGWDALEEAYSGVNQRRGRTA